MGASRDTIDARSTIFGSEPRVEQEKKKIINVLYLGGNPWPLRNRKGGERLQSIKILTRLTGSALLFENMQECKEKEQPVSPLVAAMVKASVPFRAVTSAVRLESRYPQPQGTACDRINMPQR